MNMSDVKTRGLVLLGCGKMGGAMLQGWLAQGLPNTSVWILDPFPSDWVKSLDVNLNAPLPENPAIVLIAVKPQMMAKALPSLQKLGNGETLFISVAAGTPMSFYEKTLGAQTPIIRAMPNTPAAIAKGITPLIGNAISTSDHITLAETLLQAIGQTVLLDSESQMDAVTAVSGSGPGYVFHFIETLAAAGVEQGLSPALSMQLAKATVSGAGQLAETAAETPAQLRINVTSPQGTTAAALGILMDDKTGFPALLSRAVDAAATRSRKLAE